MTDRLIEILYLKFFPPIKLPLIMSDVSLSKCKGAVCVNSICQ